MKINANIVMMLAVAVLSAGCIKDLTNKDYSTLNLPVIENPDRDPALLYENCQYTLKSGDVLEIRPNIVYSDMDDLDYAWVIDGETVSTEKDLYWECDLTGQRASAAFYMTRRSAGNSVIVRFSVILDQPYAIGWLVAAEKDGKVVYDFLQRSDNLPYTYTEYPDALETESTADSWIDCMEFWSNESSSVNGHMLSLDSDPEKTFSVEELTMLPTVTLRQEFIGETFPASVTSFSGALYCGYMAYLSDQDGRVYYRKSQTGYYTGRFSDLPLKFEGEDLYVSALIGGPYNAGFALLYDKVNDRFLVAENAYNDGSSGGAGTLSELPSDASVRSFAGEEFVYTRLIKPYMSFMDPTYYLFIVSKDASGQYVASQYGIVYEGYISIEENYEGDRIENFGEKSVITALDDTTYGLYVYYSDGSDPKKLYSAKRSASGLASPVLYHTFDSDIVSIDQGTISRTSKSIAVGLADGTVVVLDITDSMDRYVAPDAEDSNSLAAEWKDPDRKILKVDFRYGSAAKYFPV